MKTKNILKSMVVAAVCLGTMAFSSCSTSEKTVSYKEALRYFVKNDVKEYSPRIITSEAEFTRYFGMATVMGEGGMPTPVNFDKENVIAIILPETNKDTEIKIESIKKLGEKIVVSYKVITSGSPRSYSTMPCQLVKIGKKYGDNVEFVKVISAL